MATTVVGLIGLKQSGKDTFAQRLVAEHGFTRLALADPLKKLALSLNPHIGYDTNYLQDVTLRQVIDRYGWDRAKEEFPAVRQLLQNLGVSVREYVGKDAWLQNLATRASWIGGPVVVTDIRFNNEADWVVGTGGHLVRIKRSDLANTDTHVSENELAARITQHVVHNDSTVADLHRTADLFAERLTDLGLLPRPLALGV